MYYHTSFSYTFDFIFFLHLELLGLLIHWWFVHLFIWPPEHQLNVMIIVFYTSLRSLNYLLSYFDFLNYLGTLIITSIWLYILVASCHAKRSYSSHSVCIVFLVVRVLYVSGHKVSLYIHNGSNITKKKQFNAFDNYFSSYLLRSILYLNNNEIIYRNIYYFILITINECKK